MAGRGRPRGRGGATAETGAGPGRRSTRQQQQQHQQTQQSADVIDPNLSSNFDGSMPPPASRAAKTVRGSLGAAEGPDGHLEVSRRYTRRDGPARGASMAPSINSIPNTNSEFYSSQSEQINASAHAEFHTIPVRGQASSALAGQAGGTSTKRANRVGKMNSNLSKLLAASDDLFQFLSEGDREDEDWDTELQATRAAYGAYRSYFVTDKKNDLVLKPSAILDLMGINEESSDGQRTIRIIKLANLASILEKIEVTDQDDYLPLLQAWSEDFPHPYLADIPNDKDFIVLLGENALMLRTQLAIYTLRALQAEGRMTRHPYLEVASIWCTNSDELTVDMIPTISKEGDASSLDLRPLTSSDNREVEERNITRLKALCGQLDISEYADGTYSVDFSGVDFPFNNFREDLRGFAQQSFQQGRSALNHRSQIAASEAGSRVDSQIQSQLEADALAQVSPTTYKNVASSHPLPPSYPPASRIPYPPGFNSPPASQYPEAYPQVGFQSGAAFAQSAAQVTAPPTASALTTTAGRKRRAPAASAGEQGQSPAKKPRGRRKKVADAEAAAAAPSNVVSDLQAPPPPPSVQTEYPPLPGTQTEPDFDALIQRSREISAANRKVREPQVRSAWVRNDVRMLVKAVDEYGCKWSVIERMIKEGTIPFERPRDQQALRDKARLLKQDFLKADGLLPRGFDLVVLGKKEREAVKACGKNPDRREADIDLSDPERPRPINTELPTAVHAALPAPMAAIAPVAAMDPPEDESVAPEPEAVQDSVQSEDNSLAAVQAENELSALA